MIKRKEIKLKNSYVTHNKFVRELNSSQSGSPHNLIECSSKQWSTLENKSIHVSDMVIDNSNAKVKKLAYNNITLGSEVDLRRRKGVPNLIHSQWRSPMLGNTIDGVLAIVANKDELVKSNPRLIVTDGSSQELLSDNVNDVTQYKPSGIVLLMLVKWERDKIKSGYSWAKKDAMNIKRCKNNIISAHSNHFGST